MASERNVIVHIRWFLAHFDLWPRWFDPPLFLRRRKSLLRFGLRSVKYSADRIKEIYDFHTFYCVTNDTRHFHGKRSETVEARASLVDFGLQFVQPRNQLFTFYIFSSLSNISLT